MSGLIVACMQYLTDVPGKSAFFLGRGRGRRGLTEGVEKWREGWREGKEGKLKGCNA